MNFTVFKSSRRKCVHIYIHTHHPLPCCDCATNYPRQKALTSKPLKTEYPDVLTVRSCHKTQALSAGIADPWLLNHMKAEWVRMWLPLWGDHMRVRGQRGRRVLHNPNPQLGKSAQFTWTLLLGPGPWGPAVCSTQTRLLGHGHFPAANSETKPKHIFLYFPEQALLD